MRSPLPVVHAKPGQPQATLYTWSDPPQAHRLEIKLDSDPWFAWLAHHRSFRFTYYLASGQQLHLTIRPEKRGQRTYWQAWKTIAGRTTKKYLAPSATLTRAKLETAAAWFADQLQASVQADPTQPLYAAVTDLIWLVQRFLAADPPQPLAHRAQLDLDRIQRQLGLAPAPPPRPSPSPKRRPHA
jgi:hypothetical protein